MRQLWADDPPLPRARCMLLKGMNENGKRTQEQWMLLTNDEGEVDTMVFFRICGVFGALIAAEQLLEAHKLIHQLL